MTQVRLIESPDLESLEEAINRWLSHDTKITVVSTTIVVSNNSNIIAMITYKTSNFV